MDRPGPSYTAETLEVLRAARPGDELFLVLGEDALADLPHWVRPERILELATLAVARREGVQRASAVRLSGLSERVIWLKMPLVPVSATEIRERVRRGLPVGELVPPVVEAYIREHGLYRGRGGPPCLPDD